MSVQNPAVGDPATIVLVTDTIPAVITRVTPRTVVVREVEHEEPRRVNHESEPFPVLQAQGILDKPFGNGERFSMTTRGHYMHGGVRLLLGTSLYRRDYRD